MKQLHKFVKLAKGFVLAYRLWDIGISIQRYLAIDRLQCGFGHCFGHHVYASDGYSTASQENFDLQLWG
jgi:hypothetical protein